MPARRAHDRTVVDSLQELGFTSAEAKAYLALLRESPATGYELAARSGVPRSAIYGVLKRLEQHGLVNVVEHDPARYVALPGSELRRLLEARFKQRLDVLKRSLDSVASPRARGMTWTVQGYARMLEQATQLVTSSRKTLYGSMWGRETDRLADTLRARRAGGVEVILFSFNPLSDELGTVLSYGIVESELEAYWPHKIILVSDNRRALLGGAEQSDETRAVVTEEPALVEVAVANLVLDITLLGQRRGIDTSGVAVRLTRLLAPIEALANRAKNA